MTAQRQPSEREAHYRGYKITLQRHDLCWSVSLRRDSIDLPSPARGKFHTITQSERAAMAQARRRIDESLRGVAASQGQSIKDQLKSVAVRAS